MTKRLIVLLFALAALATGALACGLGRTPTPTPLPVQAPGWEWITVRTLCLEVQQSYPQIEEEFSQPIAEATERILVGLGLQVVPEEEACDATLSITLTAQALAARYRGGVWWSRSLEVGGRFYTGAEVNGQMTLAFPGHEPLTLPITGMVPTPERISGTYRPDTPAKAPFGGAWSEALLDGLAHLWGYQALIQALIQAVEDKDISVGMAAAYALGEIGPEAVPAVIQVLGDHQNKWVRHHALVALREIGPGAKEAIPVLIQALGDERPGLRGDAADALGEIGPEAVPALIQALEDEKALVVSRGVRALEAITGQDFGEDADRWQQWWEEQPPAMVTPSPGVITYTVQPGDTLAKIAAEFGVTVEAIVEANDIDDPSLINVGQVLVIPKP